MLLESNIYKQFIILGIGLLFLIGGFYVKKIIPKEKKKSNYRRTYQSKKITSKSLIQPAIVIIGLILIYIAFTTTAHSGQIKTRTFAASGNDITE